MLFRKKVLGTVAYMGGLPAVLESFAWAWGQLIQYNTEYLCGPGEIVNYEKATVSLHFFARNGLVESMRGDWLLMLDTDHAPPPDLTMRMLWQMNRIGADVATGMYRHKNGPGVPVIYQWNDDQKTVAPIANWSKEVSAFQIGSAGAGCLMVRRSVFERINDELHEKPFDMYAGLGEDHSFFLRCKKLGIAAWALPTVESPHLRVEPMLMRDYAVPQAAIIADRLATNGVI